MRFGRPRAPPAPPAPDADDIKNKTNKQNNISLRDMQPVTLNAFRFLSAFAVLGAVFHKRVLRASRETCRYCVLVGLALVSIYLGATYGVLYTSVSNAGLFGAMTVRFTPVCEFVVYRKRPDRKLGFA